MSDTPDACDVRCSLSPAALAARQAAVSELLRAHHHTRTSIDAGRLLTFPIDPQLERDLRELVALEAECCPFLTLEVAVGESEITLSVTGGKDAQGQLVEIFGA
jgi:hypothetical protein